MSADASLMRDISNERLLREASGDDHFYGAWKGGGKAAGGRPGGAPKQTDNVAGENFDWQGLSDDELLGAVGPTEYHAMYSSDANETGRRWIQARSDMHAELKRRGLDQQVNVEHLVNYQNDPSVNFALRGVEGYDAKLPVAQRAQVEAIDALITAQPRLESDLVVKRAVDDREMALISRPSGAFMHGYVSTTQDADALTHYGAYMGPNVIDVRVPAGTKVLRTWDVTGTPELGGKEILLPRNGAILPAKGGGYRFRPPKQP